MSARTRLLIVDDEEVNRDLLARRLRRHGYAVDVATSAREGLSHVDTTAVDLVLLDIQMPEMSGFEMLRELRARRNRSELPVIMVTACNQSDDVVQSLDLGANDYITKPIDLPVTLARIRALVARAEAERGLVEREERYALAVRGSKDGLWDWKIETGEFFGSARWQELLGYDLEAPAVSVEGWLSRVHDDDEGRVRAELQDHLSGKSPSFESQHRVRHRPGEYRWVMARGVAVRSAHGVPLRIAGTLTDVTDGKAADALTGLPNRVLFMDRLGRFLEYHRRLDDFRFALFFVDLDGFKRINDTRGHLAGDQVLIQVARRLEDGLRELNTAARGSGGERFPHPAGGVTVARMGGDEFGILLGGVSTRSEAAQVATRLARVLGEPFQVEGHQVSATASIGIALSGADFSESADMLRAADMALYRAKGAGQGQIEVFDQQMRLDAVERSKRETELRDAVEAKQFVIHYRPIVSMASRQVTGVEARLRWRHPLRGLIGPREFMPMADDTGLILPLGVWMLNEVCRQWHAWRVEFPSTPPVVVCVEASARQLAQHDFPEQVALVAERHGVPAGMLEIEFSESAVTANFSTVRVVVMRLKALGLRVGIDDLGSSPSSFTNLLRLPVDRLTVDPSWPDSRPQTSVTDRDVMHTAIGLAHRFDFDVVAEGVETPEQLEQLTRIDAGCGRGHVILEAIGPDAIGRLLEEGALGNAFAPRAVS